MNEHFPEKLLKSSPGMNHFIEVFYEKGDFGMLVEAVRLITKWMSMLVSLPKEKRAKLAHGFTDQILKEKMRGSQNKISCKRGCSHCCYMPVAITEDESKLLLNHLDDAKIAQLKRQANLSTQEMQEASKDVRRCAFLGANEECTIYEDRPLTCRTYFVTSPPKLCDIGKNKTIDVLTVKCFEAECVVSAAFNLDESAEINDRLMAKRILANLK